MLSMNELSDLEISQMVAQACARHLCWLIDSAVMSGNTLTLTGWALVTEGTPQDARFLVNGVPFTSVRFPIDSPDLGVHFYGVENSANARFECSVRLTDVPVDQHFRFESMQHGNTAKARRTAWWYPVTPKGDSVSGERASRVVGSGDNFNFELGGATLFHRIQDYLVERFGLRYGTMHAILDWGCGAGRLLSYFQSVAGPQVWGSDIDGDNLAFCQKRLPFAHCVVFPLVPPTTLDASMFDLVIGISVCTHLSEQHAGLVRQLDQFGFVIKGVNPSINDLIGSSSYYLDVVQTRDHIREQWGRHFEVLEFIDSLAANQDLVVMRAGSIG
jgi:SAM-dependent methyltransferase